MVQIQTVEGPVSVDMLGETLMCESVGAASNPKYLDKAFDYAAGRLDKLVQTGCSTLVDVEISVHRDIQYYIDMAARINLNFILSSGIWYFQSDIPAEFKNYSVEQMEEHMLRELTGGIGGTNIRTAVIRTVTDTNLLTPWEEKILTATAKAQVKTGVPVISHACRGAREQFDCMVEAGADPDSLIFAYVEAEHGWEGRTLQEQAKYFEDIARAGGNFYFANFFFEHHTPMADLRYILQHLSDKGLDKHVLIGLDTNFIVEDDGTIWMEDEKLNPALGARTYDYVYNGVLPLMRGWGFRDRDFHAFLAGNPKRIFGKTRI